MKNKTSEEAKNANPDDQQEVLGQSIQKQVGEIANLEVTANNITNSVKKELENYKLEFENFESRLRKEFDDSEKKLKEIEGRIRSVVSEQAIIQAQEQFKAASVLLSKQIWIWVILSILSISCGFYFAKIYLIDIPNLYEKYWNWKGAFQTSIRLTVLTGIWTISAFFIRMFRAYLQMYHQNLHRKRIANSMYAFMEGATDNQRDILLTKLVDSINDFGNPGIIKDVEVKMPSSNIIGNVSKMIPKSTE